MKIKKKRKKKKKKKPNVGPLYTKKKYSNYRNMTMVGGEIFF